MSFLTQPITLQSLFGQDRKIGEITVQVVVNESTNDILTITKQPVQQGASITDHAFKEPTVFTMNILQKDNLFTSLSKMYAEVLELQSSRVPFDVITPKRIYRNVLLGAIGQTTDKATENLLALSLSFQEIIIVNVVTTQLPRSRQRLAGATGATQSAGKKSALASLNEGVGGLFR